MTNSFQFVALPAEPFADLFALSDGELAARNVRRLLVDECPGYPCRVSLEDAAVGETVLALSYVHHDVQGPYRSAGPIFVRTNARTAAPAPGEIPKMLEHRLLSLRGYQADGIMLAADVCQGTELRAAIERMFADERIRYLQIHNARPGCFNCTVTR